MVFWAAVVAALAGWALSGFEEEGLVLGGVLGAIFGWVARRAVRAEVARSTAELRIEIAALADRLDAGPSTWRAAADEVAPAPEPVERAFAPPPAPPRPQPESFELPAFEPTPADPPEPGWIETAAATGFATARDWLLGGNTVVRVGLVLLFIGLSFLASYAASAGLFPIELRLALVALVGVALLGVGFRTRHARPGFGTALQGAGVAAIYLTLFAAARLYDTVPTLAAFALMIAVCALGCALALLQRSQALAATAFAGGYAAPLLLSTGGGAVAGLFAYYTILNVAVLAIAGRRAWRGVNLLGFVATFGMLTAWEVASNRAADFAAAQAFLAASVLIYLAVAVLYTRRTPGRLGNIVDTTLLFGPALAGFGLEVGLIGDRPFGSAFAALAFAALYLATALLGGRRRTELRVMHETMLAIGIGFVTLAVPLALGARWTSATWALEGAGAFWVGRRQARWIPRLFGLALQLVAALVFLGALDETVADYPFIGPVFVGAVLIAIALLATAWWLRTPLPHGGSRVATAFARIEAALERPAFLLGFGFWWLAWTTEATRRHLPAIAGEPPVAVFAPGVQWLLAMLAWLASAAAAQAFGRRRGWEAASLPSYAGLVALAIGFAGSTGSGLHVLELPAAAIWVPAVALHLWMLRRNDRDAAGPVTRGVLRATHVGGVWLAVAMLADMLWLGVERADLWRTGWADVVPLVGLVTVVAVLTAWTARRPASRWPLGDHAVDYLWFAGLPLAVLLAAATLLTGLLSPGKAEPLPFVPLLNPVDLGQGLGLAVLAWWRRAAAAAAPSPAGAARIAGRAGATSLAVLAFAAINTAWLRAAHHLLGVAWTPEALFASFVVQAGLALLWTLLALTLMVAAHRRGRRTLWLTGAGLLGVTVAKLLLVDLTNAQGAARVVAFMGVGALMLVVGYFAPLPPKTGDGEGER